MTSACRSDSHCPPLEVCYRDSQCIPNVCPSRILEIPNSQLMMQKTAVMGEKVMARCLHGYHLKVKRDWPIVW